MDENPGAATLADLDRTLGGELQRSISAREFRGARDETLQFTGTKDGPRRVILIGMGKTKERASSLRRAAAIAARQAVKLGTGDLAFHAVCWASAKSKRLRRDCSRDHGNTRI
jgi:leucyl aminopeptidase